MSTEGGRHQINVKVLEIEQVKLKLKITKTRFKTFDVSLVRGNFRAANFQAAAAAAAVSSKKEMTGCAINGRDSARSTCHFDLCCALIWGMFSDYLD